jgi:dienelactone hydrolase
MTPEQREALSHVSAALFDMERMFSQVIVDAHMHSDTPTFVVLQINEVSQVVRNIRDVNKYLAAAGVPVAVPPLPVVKEP